MRITPQQGSAMAEGKAGAGQDRKRGDLMTRNSWLCVWALACAPYAQAQNTYPNKPIRIIVPQSPGASTDLTARMIAIKLAAVFGQPVIVDNRPGAGSIIGTDLVAKAAPDGYTL